jgi:WD40 repeat protein
VATSNGEIQLRQLNVADPPRTIKGYAPAQFTPDGRFVLSVTSAGPNLKSHRAAIQQSDPFSGREPQTFEGSHGDLITSIAVSPDGHQVVTGSWDRTLRLWDIAKKRSVATFEGHTDRVYAVAFSPDGTRIVSASGDSTLRIWNVATQKTTRILKGHELWVTSVAFSPDGRFILSGGADKTVRVWKVGDDTPHAVLTGHRSYVNDVAFAPDGAHAVSGSSDGTVRIWRLDTFSGLVTLAPAKGERGGYAAVSQQGLFDGTAEDINELLHFVYQDEVIELGQLKERYYEPGLVPKLLGFNTTEPLRDV